MRTRSIFRPNNDADSKVMSEKQTRIENSKVTFWYFYRGNIKMLSKSKKRRSLLSRFIPLLLKGIEKCEERIIFRYFFVTASRGHISKWDFTDQRKNHQSPHENGSCFIIPETESPISIFKDELEAEVNLFKTQVERLQSEQNINDDN